MTAEFPHAESSSGLQLGPARQRIPGDVDGRQPHVDPVTLGFAQLNARFDKMDRRIDSVERRPPPRQRAMRPIGTTPTTRGRSTAGNGRSGHLGRGRGRPYRGGRGDHLGRAYSRAGEAALLKAKFFPHGAYHLLLLSSLGPSTTSATTAYGLAFACNDEGSVSGIDLSGADLAGTLDLFHFTALLNLTTFNLSGNYLNGSVPAALGNLTSLTLLDLSNNSFAGAILQRSAA
ncbi:hypothetical protein SASPL_136774 [Salvia splendens]|uniref:Uncharacterized protein n=1 Tax=Salvia splendens TaxID=180675 RepID=A0A8X8X2C2_SALSN|nr:hypothetical protein SASPL_136774 [Salvia splendens]